MEDEHSNRGRYHSVHGGDHRPWVSGDIEVLADKMSDDSRCDVVLARLDEQGTIPVTIWDLTHADEVEAGLKSVLDSDMRKAQMVNPRGAQ